MRTALLVALAVGLSRHAALLRGLQLVTALEEWQGRIIRERL